MNAMSRDTGIVLGVSGQTYMERIFWLREMATLAKKNGLHGTADYLTAQAARAEETVVNMMREHEKWLTGRQQK